MRVVFDTNIWLSGIFWNGEANKLIELAMSKKIKIIITENILSEIIEVLNKEEKFQKFIEDKKQKIEDLIRTILSFSVLIKTKSKLELIKDHPKDNIILEAALDGKADYIVSYDKHVLNMIEFREIKISEPKDFLRLLSG
jgi:putative PIN family toxin of toxin-antitoxin system